MSITSGIVSIRKSSIALIILSICLSSLAGCSYLLPDTIPSQAVTVNPGESSTATPSIAVHPPDTSSVPSQNFSPEIATQPRIPSDTAMPLRTPVHVPAQYILEAVFDYEAHSLSVVETITYENLTSDELADLLLVIEPNLVPNGFILLSMNWQGGQAIESYTLDGNQMQISLPQPLQPGEMLGLEIDYQLEIPQLVDMSNPYRPLAYGYSDLQTNIVDWYPYVPPYRQGEGWLVHPAWGLGEYQVFDVANFDVTLSLANPVPDLVIAASSPAVQDGDRYSYHLAAGRTFVLSASTNYIMQTTAVGDVTINSYTFTYDKHAGQEVLYSTAAALRLYSELILPYARTSLSIVEADFLDGMEYDGLFFLSHGFYDLYDNTPKGYLTFISAHETAHQWWYALVGNDQAEEPWLDEALSTYMELIYYETLYSDTPHSSDSLVDWWWYYRVNFYNPQGWVDASIYDFNENRSYRDAVYLTGARFLDDLRNMIGDQAFFSFLSDYAGKYAYKIATADDFFSTLKNHTSQYLDELLATYFQFSQR